MVTRVALADVVEQGPDEQQVWPLDPVDQQRRLGRGHEQVPIDGEAVVGVALRSGPAGLPFGQDRDEQSHLVEVLDDRHCRFTRCQQVHEEAPRLLGPGLRQRRRLGGKALERTSAKEGLVARRRLGTSQDR